MGRTKIVLSIIEGYCRDELQQMEVWKYDQMPEDSKYVENVT